jgi:hypothetical protein
MTAALSTTGDTTRHALDIQPGHTDAVKTKTPLFGASR